ncbi:uncharacterized protein LOC126024162 [Suncus etruscus]|uniref:uncharacterized protein LOC126024162 n=1 Tax=Suncus etruscus TaxID=109475 RepID=UPI0021106708|nr:uncharacterized protein LOC126024162 [Suncus etruscus]
MGARLLYWVALCLLGAGTVDPEVMQTPKHLIKARSQTVTLSCSYESGHLSVFWYQQTVGQGLKFLIQYYNGEVRDKGDIPDHFSVEQFKNSSSKLSMKSTEVNESALYLCASSLTALPAQEPPTQKLSLPAQEVVEGTAGEAKVSKQTYSQAKEERVHEAGLVDSAIIQMPKHLLKAKSQAVNLILISGINLIPGRDGLIQESEAEEELLPGQLYLDPISLPCHLLRTLGMSGTYWHLPLSPF